METSLSSVSAHHLIFVRKFLPIHAQNCTQQMACIRRGMFVVVLMIVRSTANLPPFALDSLPVASVTCISTRISRYPLI